MYFSVRIIYSIDSYIYIYSNLKKRTCFSYLFFQDIVKLTNMTFFKTSLRTILKATFHSIWWRSMFDPFRKSFVSFDHVFHVFWECFVMVIVRRLKPLVIPGSKFMILQKNKKQKTSIIFSKYSFRSGFWNCFFSQP